MNRRIVRAFAIAPALTPTVMSIGSVLVSLPEGPYFPFVFWLAGMTGAMAYAGSIVLGTPLLMFLRRTGRLSGKYVIVGGAISGALTWFGTLAVIALFSDWRTSLATVPDILLATVEMAPFYLLSALLGAGTGALFWRLARE